MNDKTVFRAALEQVEKTGRFGLRDRRVFRQALASPYLLDLAHDVFVTQLTDDIQPVGEFGDGTLFNTIADRIGKWFVWIIENQDAVIAFFQKIIELISGLIKGIT